MKLVTGGGGRGKGGGGGGGSSGAPVTGKEECHILKHTWK